MKYILLTILILTSINGCVNSENQASQTYNMDVIDKTIFSNVKLLTVEMFKVDHAARTYTLGECMKMVHKKLKTNKHCINASIAEYENFIEDLSLMDRSITDSEKQEIRQTIISSYNLGVN